MGETFGYGNTIDLAAYSSGVGRIMAVIRDTHINIERSLRVYRGIMIWGWELAFSGP